MSTSSGFDALTRRAALGLGVLTFLLGALALVVVDPLVNVLPSTYTLVGLAGFVAFLLGLWMARNRYRGGVSQTAVPNVERVISTPPPGRDIDEALYRLTRYRQGTVEYRDQIQERLASVAVDVIRQRDDCSRAEAIHKLEEGTWTDNRVAQSFFAGGSPPSRSLGERISDRVFGGGESGYERWVRITTDTIIQRAGMESMTVSSQDDDDDDGGILARLTGGSDDGRVATLSPEAYRAATERDDAEKRAEGVYYHDLISTGHWRGASAFALVAAGWGIVSFQPAILLISVVPVAFVAVARAATEPSLTDLAVERTVTEEAPQPGEPVQVTVRVENEGDSFMPDLRLVDRVPGSMEVVEGSPRLATALGSGATATFSYTVVAERGDHEWPVIAVGRDFTGTLEREATVEVEQGLTCTPSLTSLTDAPVRSQTSLFSGEVDTDVGGSGLEFFSVREYREGDPMKRIDWKRKARTGELATIDYRLERAAKVVLLFDARESAYVSAGPNERHAVDQAVDAGMGLFATLFDRSDLVGIAAFDTVPCWLGPGAGDEHAERARQLFASHPAVASTPPALKEVESQYVDPMTHVRRQLSPEAQIMLFSPLCDDYTAEVARRLDSVGHLVTVVSPDPTADRTPGQRLAAIERQMRITNLREHGIRVIDWDTEQPLGLEMDRAQQRWVA